MGDEKRKPTWIMFPYTPTEEELARARELLASEYHPKSGTYKEGTTIGTDPAVIPSSHYPNVHAHPSDVSFVDEDWQTHPMNEILHAACRVIAQYTCGSYYSKLVECTGDTPVCTTLYLESTQTTHLSMRAYVEIILTPDMTTDEATMITKSAVMEFNLDQSRMQNNIPVGGMKSFSLDRTMRDAKLAKIINVDEQGKIKVGGKAKDTIPIQLYSKVDHGRERG